MLLAMETLLTRTCCNIREHQRLLLLARSVSNLAGAAATTVPSAAASSPEASVASTSTQAEAAPAAACGGWLHRGVREHPNAGKLPSNAQL